MKVHAIQTGSVRIKRAQRERRGPGPLGMLAIFADPHWTDWLPTYAWLIDHADGLIVVDTGQGAHLLDHSRSLHPYVRWEVEFRIAPEQEIGPQLRALGVGSRDVKRVVLTHLHMDHDGGLRHFPNSEILVAPGELEMAKGWMGALRGYLPDRWPSWFNPIPLELSSAPIGPFTSTERLTAAGDVVAVATPGHTAHHLSVIVYDDDAAVFLAGDSSYNEELMLARRVDGVRAQMSMSADGRLRQSGSSRPGTPRSICQRTTRRLACGLRPARCRALHSEPSESRRSGYIGLVVNNRKEVIQCLIVYRRGRRHS